MAATEEVTREQLIAEYVLREAMATVGNRIYATLNGEEIDLLALQPETDSSETVILDTRLAELAHELWPEWDEDDPELVRVETETIHATARILRSIVYHSDYLRGEAQRLFELASTRREGAR